LVKGWPRTGQREERKEKREKIEKEKREEKKLIFAKNKTHTLHSIYRGIREYFRV
jgi:hypothetical protein